MFARTCSALAAVMLAAATVSCGGTKTQSEEPKTSSDATEASGEDEESMEDIEKYLEEEGESSTSTESAPPSDGKAASGAGAGAEAGDAARQTPEERRNAIIGLVKAKRESVANCYKMAKKKNPKIGTKIAVTFVLKADGKLKSEPVIEKERSDIDDADVVKCTIDVIKSIEFPPHPKGMETTFTYPFGF